MLLDKVIAAFLVVLMICAAVICVVGTFGLVRVMLFGW